MLYFRGCQNELHKPISEYILGRQPIYDRQRTLVAYELLYRSANSKVTPESDGQRATEQLVVDTLLEYGLDNLCDRSLAFVNMTRANLLSDVVQVLPRDRVVLEILEDVQIDADLITAVEKLAAAGYTIALDDFIFSAEWEPLLRIAKIVKVDLLAQLECELETLVKRLEPYGVELLAEKVESAAIYEKCLDLGFRYFQGYYLQRPQIVKGKRLPSSGAQKLRILAELNRPNIQIGQLAETIRSDPGLCFKLLKFINSASFAFSSRIDSIERAIVMLGLTELKRWASLIALSETASGAPTNTMSLSLSRGRMCEKLAETAELAEPSSYFLVGLLSTLEIVLKMPMAEIVSQMPLSEEVVQGLLGHGSRGEALDCVRKFENWRLNDVRFQHLDLKTLGDIYLASIAWAQAHLVRM